jgi:hypothetical protein
MIERTYIESGVQVTVLKTMGQPLRLKPNGGYGFIDMSEVPTDHMGKSWRELNNDKRIKIGLPTGKTPYHNPKSDT